MLPCLLHFLSLPSLQKHSYSMLCICLKGLVTAAFETSEPWVNGRVGTRVYQLSDNDGPDVLSYPITLHTTYSQPSAHIYCLYYVIIRHII